MNVVVTGASRGVGYEIARRLSKEGGHVVFALSRNGEALKKLSEECNSPSLVPMICDISSESNVASVVNDIGKKVTGIEILINNAGQLIQRPFLELQMSDWQAVFNVNVFGVFNITKQLMPLMMKGNIFKAENLKAHIVNIASMGGVQGSLKFKGLSAYSSSKGALITITECFSEELKEEGIRVNCIALGSVETEMFREAFKGLQASMTPVTAGEWIVNFASEGYRFFNGKIIQMSNSTP